MRNKFYWVIFALAFGGIVFTLQLIIKFGIGNAITDSATFHSWRATEFSEFGYADTLGRIFLLSSPAMVAAVVIFQYRQLTKRLRMVGVLLTILFVLNCLFFSGRGQLLYALIPGGLSMLYLKRIRIRLRYIIMASLAVGLIGAITLHRLSYYGSQASTALIGYFGIEETLMSNEQLESPLGKLFVNSTTYLCNSFINFNTIVFNEENMLLSMGTQSFRLLNPLIMRIDVGFGMEQKIAALRNADYLFSLYPAAIQWPFTYGYFVADFGIWWCLPFIAAWGSVFGYFSAVVRRKASLYSFEYGYIIQYAAFTGFIMPFTAMYQGVFCIIIFIALRLLEWSIKPNAPRFVSRRIGGSVLGVG